MENIDFFSSFCIFCFLSFAFLFFFFKEELPYEINHSRQLSFQVLRLVGRHFIVKSMFAKIEVLWKRALKFSLDPVISDKQYCLKEIIPERQNSWYIRKKKKERSYNINQGRVSKFNLKFDFYSSFCGSIVHLLATLGFLTAKTKPWFLTSLLWRWSLCMDPLLSKKGWCSCRSM